ncbi:rRNA maturation RNase YbeY [Patescibacteria group bacterium]|nr:rRNA maturation RNase YbeY [Patescibacteria group bacterium]
MIAIKNLSGTSVDRKLLTGVAKIVLKGENTIIGKEISLVFVKEDKIKEINKKYRRKNKPTDVLSFEGINEIFICPSLAKGRIKHVLIHALLHLSGYDHKAEKETELMEKKEIHYLSLCQKAKLLQG